MAKPRRLRYLCRDKTRHGKTVYYVRVPGKQRVRIRAEYGSVEFMREYHAAISDMIGAPTATGARTPEHAPRRRRAPERGFVYFIKHGDLVKIGFSTDVDGRLKSLQTGAPFPYVLLHKIPGGRAEEAEFHRRFKHLRRHGEWFAMIDELRELLAPYRRPIILM